MEKTAMKVQRYLMSSGMFALAAFAAGLRSSDTRLDRGHPGLRHPSWRTSQAGARPQVAGTLGGGHDHPTGGTTTAGAPLRGWNHKGILNGAGAHLGYTHGGGNHELHLYGWNGITDNSERAL